MEAVSFLGLGKMGMGMAANLLKGGAPLYVYNRSVERTSGLAQQGAKVLMHPCEAFQKAKIAISMLANDQALEDVVLGPNGLLENIKPGCTHVSMSTVSPETTRKLATLHRDKGAYFLAAPVFGRPDMSAAGKLVIALAGDTAGKKAAKPYLELLGQRIDDFGEQAESANILKLAGNFMILAAIEAMGEAFHLSEHNGLDRNQVATFFAETLFACPVYRNYSKLIASEAFDPAGFKMSLGFKDINLVKDAAKVNNTGMPLADLLQRMLKDEIAKGNGDLDWAAITLAANPAMNAVN